MQNLTDGELVRLAQQGSERAFGELMKRHARGMHQIAYSILRDQEEAADELQNAWWKVWQNLDRFAGESRFSTWMTRIVINQCLMRLRQSRRRRFLYMDAPAPGEASVCFELRDQSSSPEEDVARREATEVVCREIGRIPPLLRQALVLREVMELPMPQVAEELGISLAAAKSRLLRAKHELRVRLEKYCGGMGPAGVTA
uniref:RNA polymerase, sigma-24 subunit, ECF subfamily n=1 Tax=Solibacter usitatus (strain Ellin6076) TaxID=234267 RepID=Q026G5_SOLUE